MLNAQQYRFVIEYCVDYNATQAYIRAGYSENGAQQSASALLSNPFVKEAIKERQSQLAAAAQLTPEWVLERWMELATGDASELSHVRRVNCRHCWGIGHEYQWTPIEYRHAVEEAIALKQEPPMPLGGLDFDAKREPNTECRECSGEGRMTSHMADTRKVKGNARKLFAGVKQTANGIEVKVRDQDAALKNLANYLGMTVDRKEISGPGGKPLGIVNLKPGDLTDEQLAAIIEGGTDDNAIIDGAK